MSLRNYIDEQLNRLRIEVNAETLEQLCDYIKELVKWGRVHNLSGSDSPEELVDRLLLDSALALFHIDFIGKFSSLNEFSIIDIGSGNGSPGIVWAICNEDISLKIVEKVKKSIKCCKSIKTHMIFNFRVQIVLIRSG